MNKKLVDLKRYQNLFELVLTKKLKEFPILDAYQTPTGPTKLSSKDSEIVADRLINSQDPNELLKALMSKDNEQILKELIAKKK